MLSHHHHGESRGASATQTQGFVWNWARRYDLLMGFDTLGRERAFRPRRIQPGPTELPYRAYSPSNIPGWTSAAASSVRRSDMPEARAAARASPQLAK